jgi:hypothetical protein
MSELALDHVERHALAGHLDGVRVAKLMRAKRLRTPARTASWRSCGRTAGADHGRPHVGPLTTQRSAPIGVSALCSSQGRSCSQPQSSIPTSRRLPPLPERTRIAPRPGSRSRSASDPSLVARRAAGEVAGDGCGRGVDGPRHRASETWTCGSPLVGGGPACPQPRSMHRQQCRFAHQRQCSGSGRFKSRSCVVRARLAGGARNMCVIG